MSYVLKVKNEYPIKLVSDFLEFSMKHYLSKITTYALLSISLKKKSTKLSMDLKQTSLSF